MPSQYESTNELPSYDDQDYNKPHLVPRKSPLKEKYGKLGSLYNPNNERINILFKDGDVRDISQVDSPLIHQNLSHPVKKFYICFYQLNH